MPERWEGTWWEHEGQSPSEWAGAVPSEVCDSLIGMIPSNRLVSTTGAIFVQLHVKLRCQPQVHDNYLLRILILVSDQTGPYKDPKQVIILAQSPPHITQ